MVQKKHMNALSPGKFRFVLYVATTMLLAGYGAAQDTTRFIVVDQFGYLPVAQKIAVIRDPQTGFDASKSFTPGTDYALVDKNTGIHVLSGNPVAWNSGATDASSGDKAWWFDFSDVETPGTYYVLDITNNKRSYEFVIAENLYNEILRHAVRAFFYQRAGHEKAATYAGAAWADGASHIKNLQDKNARQYNRTTDASTELDLSGGWYDAGDYNKYTNWTAGYVVDFMKAYLEAPTVWSDDYNIPESGNHIPDLLDEAKWGIDHLLRMQRPDGSVLSIVGLAHGSPPSSATGPSYYGTASTSATLNSAGAFAIASTVFASRGMVEYADQLKDAAEKAWTWASSNPNVIFENNKAGTPTSGLGAGQQETDDYGRLMAKLEAACYLFELTGKTTYRDFFDANYNKTHLIEWNFAYPFETTNQEVLLYYTAVPNATTSVCTAIITAYKNAMNTGAENFVAFTEKKDPYQAHLQDYTWGSNAVKAGQGLMYLNMNLYHVDATKVDDANRAAEGYLHYLHGVNPMGIVYLSNMYAYGADHSVNEFYHSWFTNGSTKWDRVGISTYGPAPGFVTGGPNPSYDIDGCCPSNCGGSNAMCTSENLTPPKSQPEQKSYKDFNTSWPLNSWSVTENSNGYQINYIRLLSHFAKANYDCSGTPDGTAAFDICNRCAGGTTGVTPVEDEELCTVITSAEKFRDTRFKITPNPTIGAITITPAFNMEYEVSVINTLGIMVLTPEHRRGISKVNLDSAPAGIYFIITRSGHHQVVTRIAKQ
jgi:endoglucanase